jgi:type I site-specific restriction-modification system R (restriction) subunit
LVGNPKRIDLIAGDLVQHYERRLEAMEGKAMIVCMSRRIWTALHGLESCKQSRSSPSSIDFSSLLYRHIIANLRGVYKEDAATSQSDLHPIRQQKSELLRHQH